MPPTFELFESELLKQFNGYKPWRETIISLCVMVGVVNELHMNIMVIIFVLSFHT